MAFAAPWTACAGGTAKRVLITGANVGGIGGETALGLVRALPDMEELYLCARDENKSAAVAEEVRKVAPARLEVRTVPLDLASLVNARDCARTVSSMLDGNHLDVAVLNAGVMACPLAFTEDDIEYQYQVNHLAHAMLVASLGEQIRRQVFVSSTAVAISRSRDTPPLVDEKKRATLKPDKYGRWLAYGDSKLAMSLFARALALEGADAVSLHPGVVNTELQRHILPESLFEWGKKDGFLQDVLRGVSSLAGLKTPKQGAELSLKLATDNERDYEKGALYFDKYKKAPKPFAPLLYRDAVCKIVLQDTIKFLNDFVRDNQGEDLVLETAVMSK